MSQTLNEGTAEPSECLLAAYTPVACTELCLLGAKQSMQEFTHRDGTMACVTQGCHQAGSHSFPSTRSMTQHPLTCGPGPRRCDRMSALSQPLSSKASARTAERTGSRRFPCGHYHCTGYSWTRTPNLQSFGSINLTPVSCRSAILLATLSLAQTMYSPPLAMRNRSYPAASFSSITSFRILSTRPVNPGFFQKVYLPRAR